MTLPDAFNDELSPASMWLMYLVKIDQDMRRVGMKPSDIHDGMKLAHSQMLRIMRRRKNFKRNKLNDAQ